MVLKADWLLSDLVNRQAALWDCLYDGFDEYWEEPDAMTRERALWAHSLIRWCRY